MTAADLVILELADSEAAALEWVRELGHENVILRAMVSETLTQLARTMAHLDAARQTIHALRAAEQQAGHTARPAA